MLNLTSFCINLDRRQDRWSKVQNEFKKHNLDVFRWSATDSKQHNITNHSAILRSYRSLFNHCIKLKYNSILVFEDDVLLRTNFIQELNLCLKELPDNFEVLSLHSYKAQYTQISERIFKLNSPTFGSHATIFTKKSIEKITSTPLDISIESWLFRPINNFYGVSLNHTLAFQDGIDSDIPETQVLEEYRHFYKLYFQ